MKMHWNRFVAVLAVIALSSTSAFALDWQALLRSEEGFLAEMGERATVVAPGVYEIQMKQGETARVAFGARGQEFDRAWVEAELFAALAVQAKATEPSKNLDRYIRRLEELAADLRPSTDRAAVTGSTCTFEYSLDGGLVAGDVFGKAKIGLGVDFGPQPPVYPNRSTSNLLVANLWGVCHEESASDSFVGGLGYAESEAHLPCTGSACQGWRSFNTVTESGCATGYRSLRRTGGNLFCQWL